MVGGRKEEGGFTINNSNVFAALDTLKKKKNKDKKSGSAASSNKVSLSSKTKEHDPPQVFWQPTPLKATSWADVDEDDDDDYYATAAPLSSAWAPTPSHLSNDPAHLPEESESEDDMLDLGDEEVEEDHDHETEPPARPDPVLKKAPQTPAPPKEPERQLSKKERKKKELAELDALLADFGVSNDNTEGAAKEKKTEENKVQETDNGDKSGGLPTECKSSKKKKKKDKTSKEAKESQEQPNSSEVGPDQTESSAGKEPADEDASSVDVKERLKKLAASKKKKSSKEMDGASKAAASEAAARNARLAAAKKKEKNHYNQQPVR